MSGFVHFVSPSSLTFAGLIEQAFKAQWRKVSPLPIVMIRSHDKRLDDTAGGRGIVLPVSNSRVLKMVEGFRMPAVNTSERLPPCACAINIRYDSDEIGGIAAEHLAAVGFRRFFFVGDPPSAFSEARRAGFAKSLEKRGLRLEADFGFEKRDRMDPETTEQAEARQVTAWLSEIGPSGGVFAANDLIGVRFLRALRICEPDYADTIGIVGVDDDFSRLDDPSEGEPLTSVVPNFAGMGTNAADALERAVQHGDYEPGKVIYVRGAKLVERETTGGFSCADPLLSKIARWISSEINRGHSPTVGEVLARYPMSERSLSEKFRKYRGESMRNFIMQKRVQRAARMLLDSDLSVAEIAQRCGFNKHADLSERFAKYMGCSPTQYRRHHSA
ncbi:MAG: helix-turn-helix domain-containing protein [Opitutales bacterium]|nr:helix-turn-helix domain-containing protein [Opitutales bacterium]